jgi:hypothetical protein
MTTPEPPSTERGQPEAVDELTREAAMLVATLVIRCPSLFGIERQPAMEDE